jgi:hypothetical protein
MREDLALIYTGVLLRTRGLSTMRRSVRRYNISFSFLFFYHDTVGTINPIANDKYGPAELVDRVTGVKHFNYLRPGF